MRRLVRWRQRRGSARFTLLLVLGAIGLYAAIKLAMPYYACKDLERTMSYWGKIALHRGDSSYSELRDKIQWVIDRHHLPLTVDEVQILHDPSRKTLTLSAEYSVFVTFPGYEHVLHFRPYAKVTAEEF